MKGDGGDDGREPSGGVHGPARRLDVGTDLDDAGDADSRRTGERFGRVDQVSAFHPVVEVAVIINDRNRQRFRCVRPG